MNERRWVECPKENYKKYGSRAVLSNRDRRNLDRAIKAASTSTSNKKHGAVVVVGGRILAVATNSDRNDPNIVQDPKTQAAVHAEVAALRACGRTRVSGGTIYVARVNPKGAVRMSKPCERCQKTLRDAGIKKVVYTISNTLEL